MAVNPIGTPNAIKYMNMVNQNSNQMTSPPASSPKEQTSQYPPSMFDKVMDKVMGNVVNKRDIQDTVTVPRSIFKGYLGIMMGTTILTIGSFIPKLPKTSNLLKIAGLVISAIGTFDFVKMFFARKKEENK